MEMTDEQRWKEMIFDEDRMHPYGCSEWAERAHAAFEEMTERIANDAATLKLYQQTLEAICQTAGKALGYPWIKDDQKNFPGATEADGVCIGEHVPETIVDELAQAYLRLKQFADLSHDDGR